MAALLPIDSILERLAATAAHDARFVVEAPAGAGKTTRVPVALWRAGLFTGEIWVAEPRRLAAKLVAHRVSTELGEQLGGLVGYTVRFDDCTSSATRIRYVTSGILLRRLLADPNLVGVDCVILDEFHERHLDTDLALALVAQAQARRAQLRLILMSATLDGERLAQVLGNCPRLRCEGRIHPLQIEFQGSDDERPLEKRVSSALRRLILDDPQTCALVFLPGAAEIRRVHSTILPLCEQANLDIAVLHGDLPLDAQTKAVAPGDRPRVVLTTNIAESSITVEGVTAVIDSGLSRQKDYSTTSGLSRLSLQKISRAAAIQRAGRAGRTGPGRVMRLFTRGDFETRPEYEIPEILRADFSEALLMLVGAKTGPCAAASAPSARRSQSGFAKGKQPTPAPSSEALNGLLLIDIPTAAAVEAAQSLLTQLGAIDSMNQLTAMGRRMLPLPVPPRFARLLIECASRDIADLGALAVALLSERELRLDQRNSMARRDGQRRTYSGDSDVLESVEAYLRVENTRASPAVLRAAGVDPIALSSVRRAHQQLRRLLHCPRRELALDEVTEEALALAFLVAYPDRVAKRRNPSGPEFVLRSGAETKLSESSVVTGAPWIVAVDVEERREGGRSRGSFVRVASAIRVDWLLDMLSDQLSTEDEHFWIDPPGRVEVRSRIRLGSVTVEESRRPARPGPAVAAVLRETLDRSGRLQSDELSSLSARLALLAPDSASDVSSSADQLLEGLLQELLLSRNDLVGLDGGAIAQQLLARLPHARLVLLRNEVPEFVQLSNGRRCQVHYEIGRTPWIASRLQDFFGLRTTPTILLGQRKLVVHLLAPNQRAVQITDDLEGFWTKHYAEIRRELMRRYPRHPWPENGLTAAPPDLRPARRKS